MITIKEIKRLSDDQLRIKIAKVLGWRKIGKHKYTDSDEGQSYYTDYGGSPVGENLKYHEPLPYYPTDLNDMNDALKFLDKNQRDKYVEHFTGVHCDTGSIVDWSFRFHTASARERAEIFVLTVK